MEEGGEGNLLDDLETEGEGQMACRELRG